MDYDLRINPNSEVPKYKQVVDLIISDIEVGIFKKGQRIPSINEISEELLLSRDTVEKAYLHLKKKGVLLSVRGKGYYVNQTNIRNRLKIALIFNKLSNYKRSIYYSFVETIGNRAGVDVFIYNYRTDKFEEIIDNQLTNYDYFVILPLFKDNDETLKRIIEKIPQEKVLLIDKNLDALIKYPVVYQEFEKDIQSALKKGLHLIKKYKKISLVFPANEYYSRGIVRGFQIFCQVNALNFSIINNFNEQDVKKEQAYVLISDDDLYRFIKICRLKKWKLGTDVGIVAYNDTPVKELLEDGITTISTNHNEIGRMAAQMIISKDFKRVKSPFYFIKRKSL